MLYYKTFVKNDNHEWVIFVHGAGGSSSIWFKQLREFKENFNVLMIDLRGHGKSKEILQQYYEKDYSFKLISQDILDVMNEAGIGRAHFIGISLGTIIIRTIGELHPERVQSMILSGAVMRLNIRSRILISLGHFFKKVVPFMWLYKLFARVILPRKRHSESRNLFVREAKKLYKKDFLKWFNLTRGLNPLLRYFRDKELDIPTLYIMGSEDHLFLPAVKNMVKNHRQSLLKVVKQCGHVVNVEQPTLFNRISLAFLKQKSLT